MYNANMIVMLVHISVRLVAAVKCQES